MPRIAVELTSDALLYAAACSLAFLACVAILDPKFARTPIGKSLLILDAGLLMLYVPSILHRFAGLQISQTGFAWFYLCDLVLVGSAVLWRTVILVRAQLRGRKEHTPAAKEAPWH